MGFKLKLNVNTFHHCFRQAANCACCGPFVKGSDSAKKKNNKSTLALPLTKAPQQAYLWLGGEMVALFYIYWHLQGFCRKPDSA
jgi:hypothetical protein